MSFGNLRAEAETLAAPFPDLLAAADRLASTVLLGDHGRRAAGMGDSFWQFRPAQPGDPLRQIDWRRSARADSQFIREREWQIAQTVLLWVDQAASMGFASGPHETKLARARVLALACAILLIRGGERVGLTGFSLPPQAGEAQITRLAQAFSTDADQDFGLLESRGMVPHARALFVSDFMGDPAPVEAALTKAADRGVRGAMLMVLDPEEEAFPYDGRTIFQSMGGQVTHETLKAGDLRHRYLDRLAARKDLLSGWARAAGWQFRVHHTGDSAQSALLWLFGAMEAV